jgi:23S rRNA pseudouridine1911/1915/1917 synthase
MNISDLILHTDPQFLIINKPAGLLVHADGHSDEKTLVDFLVEQFPDIVGVGEPMKLKDGTVIDRPGIVHRLDKDTSGILIVARNQEMFLHLKEQFQNHTIVKEYHAFVHGIVKKDFGVVDISIARSPRDFRRYSAGRGKRGQERDAITEYYTVYRLLEDGLSYIKLKPKTGRTHQLRVHMQYLQHPMIGDTLYAPGKPKLLGFERQALHARAIDFSTLSGEILHFEAPFPKDFEDALIYCKTKLNML